MVLSREGQQAIAAEAHGYIPLNERDLLQERAKIDVAPGNIAETELERPAFTAHSAQVRPSSKKAPYVLSEGSIYFAGNDLVDVLFQKYNALFRQTHPGFTFKMDMQDSNLAIPGIISGKSAFGPIARDAMKQELDGFTALYGYPPTDILLGYNQTPNTDIFPPGKTPPAIWTNATNPLPMLTLAQLTRVFMTGAKGGDITEWGQLGLGGEWARRAIHVYLPGNPDAAFVFYEGEKMGGKLRYTPRAEWLPGTRDVMSAIAQDPFGIGLIGFWPPDSGWDRQAELGSRAKLLGLSASADDKVSHAAMGDLYPLTPGIHIYFNRMPGKPIEPWLKDYLTLVLSKEGQELLILMAHEVGNSFIPLGPEELAKQLAKIQ